MEEDGFGTKMIDYNAYIELAKTAGKHLENISDALLADNVELELAPLNDGGEVMLWDIEQTK